MRVKKNGKYYMTTCTSISKEMTVPNLYDLVLGDTIARYHRITDYAVSFLNSSITHLSKEKYFQEIRNLYSISCDLPSYTYGSDNTDHIRGIFKKLLENGDIYHCENTYMLRVSRFQQQLKNYIEKNESFIQPDAAKAKIYELLCKGPVSDVQVSVSDPSSVITVPNDNSQYISSWFSGVCCYITGIGYNPAGESSDQYRTLWPADLQLVRESSIVHGIYWPVILLALGEPLPVCIYCHPDPVMSEPEMTVKFLTNSFSVDTLRYSLLSSVPADKNIIISKEKIIDLYQSDLSGMLSSLLGTTLSMCNQYFGGIVSFHDGAKKDVLELSVEKEISSMSGLLKSKMDSLKIADALQVIFHLYRTTQAYMEQTSPWTLYENAGSHAKLENILYHLLDGIQTASSVIGAFLPDTCDRILEQINSPEITCDELVHCNNYISGNKVAESPDILFETYER